MRHPTWRTRGRRSNTFEMGVRPDGGPARVPGRESVEAGSTVGGGIPAGERLGAGAVQAEGGSGSVDIADGGREKTPRAGCAGFSTGIP